METAAHPQFCDSLLHSHLFRYHVLRETTLPNPGFLPYYNEHFFNTIRHVYQSSTLNVRTMYISQWTQVLTEDGLTMELGQDDIRQYNWEQLGTKFKTLQAQRPEQ